MIAPKGLLLWAHSNASRQLGFSFVLLMINHKNVNKIHIYGAITQGCYIEGFFLFLFF